MPPFRPSTSPTTSPLRHWAAGNYYVAGILCQSEGASYAAQPALPPVTEGAFLAYLDV